MLSLILIWNFEVLFVGSVLPLITSTHTLPSTLTMFRSRPRYGIMSNIFGVLSKDSWDSFKRISSSSFPTVKIKTSASFPDFFVPSYFISLAVPGATMGAFGAFLAFLFRFGSSQKEAHAHVLPMLVYRFLDYRVAVIEFHVFVQGSGGATYIF